LGRREEEGEEREGEGGKGREEGEDEEGGGRRGRKRCMHQYSLCTYHILSITVLHYYYYYYYYYYSRLGPVVVNLRSLMKRPL